MSGLGTGGLAVPGGLAIVPAVSFDGLSFALAMAGVGAIVGHGFAAYRYGRDRRVNTTRISFSWTLFGFVLGWLIPSRRRAVLSG